MTLAVGATCAEGTVVLTDSLTSVFDRGEWHSEFDSNRKLHLAPSAGLAFVYSGELPYELQTSEVFTRRELAHAARELLATFSSIPRPPELLESLRVSAKGADGGPLDQADLDGTDLLVANCWPETPRLGLLTTRRGGHELWVGDEGGVLVGGAAYQWWREQPQPGVPATLAEARAVALDIAQRFHHHQYGTYTHDMRNFVQSRLGRVERPTCGPPYVFLVIEPALSHLTRWLVGVDKHDHFTEPQQVEHVPDAEHRDHLRLLESRLAAIGLTPSDLRALVDRAKTGDEQARGELDGVLARLQ